jgi:hypothetical protein
MVLDEYYSASPDRDAPMIEFVTAQTAGGTTTLQVRAGDPSGLSRVVVAYTDHQGAWESVDLTRNAASGAWQGTIPTSGNVSFFVQAVDAAGNVAIDDNNGWYYGDVTQVHLPLILKNQKCHRQNPESYYHGYELAKRALEELELRRHLRTCGSMYLR